ncbi:transcriptional regulator [Lacticaseibacillus paracasei]|uniref:transcriptional regulator n=1 Tax=Lacticaseibacillus paracasei TaxID=1597 RepID=UPI0021A2F55E|nr:transcriptional regulator [Lacticaseibacillus paracasei]
MDVISVILFLLGALAIIVGVVALVISLVTKKSKKKWAYTILAGLVTMFVGVGISAATNSNNRSTQSADSSSSSTKAKKSSSDDDTTDDDSEDASDESSSSEAVSSSAFNEADYSTSYTFDQLARTPDQYKDKKVAFTGQVIQVMESDSETDLRVAINGTLNDIALVAFDPSILNGSHVLEGDKVTFYGTSKGTTSYKATSGQKITVPEIIADKVTDLGKAPDDYEN